MTRMTEANGQLLSILGTYVKCFTLGLEVGGSDGQGSVTHVQMIDV